MNIPSYILVPIFYILIVFISGLKIKNKNGDYISAGIFIAEMYTIYEVIIQNDFNIICCFIFALWIYFAHKK